MFRKTNGLLATTVLLGSALLVAATSMRPMPFQPESKLWVDGGSTVRDYTCRATKIDGSVTPTTPGAPLPIAEVEKGVRTADLSIAVASLDCGNGTMDDHMRKALKASEHPRIEYRLNTSKIQRINGDEGAVLLTGKVKIAGVEKAITTEATMVQDKQGGIRVRGSHDLVMSEYGVKPPTLMMGTLKVKDQVKVGFDVMLRP